MNARIRIVCALCFVSASSVSAGDAGRVLLVDYDRIIEGEIVRDGTKFRLKIGGGEMSIPATNTTLLLADREEAYRVMRSRAKIGDPLEHVRLSRWCQANNLPKRAVEEAEEALALRPNDRSFARFRDEARARSAVSLPPSVVDALPMNKHVAAESPTVDIRPESYTSFVTKVQPILMNVCAQCHAGEAGGAFRLTIADSLDLRGTQANLQMARAFLNKDQPHESPLLVRATSVHGNSGRPPIKDRQTVAFRHLEDWARLAAGKPPMALGTNPPAQLPTDVETGSKPLPVELPTQPANISSKPGNQPRVEPKPVKTGDPFDPDEFNQRLKETPKPANDAPPKP
jgi:hypothetical protein